LPLSNYVCVILTLCSLPLTNYVCVILTLCSLPLTNSVSSIMRAFLFLNLNIQLDFVFEQLCALYH